MSRPHNTPYDCSKAPRPGCKPTQKQIDYKETLRVAELKLVAEGLLNIRLPTIGSVTRRLNATWDAVYTPKGIALKATHCGISIREGNKVDPFVVKEFLPEARLILIK
jgi:hypothetical protein